VASLEVRDPTSAPLFIVEELQTSHAELEAVRSENERLRQDNRTPAELKERPCPTTSPLHRVVAFCGREAPSTVTPIAGTIDSQNSRDVSHHGVATNDSARTILENNS